MDTKPQSVDDVRAKAGIRERATELQFLWSCVGIVLILLIVGQLCYFAYSWFAVDQDLRARWLVDTTAESQFQLETYKALSQTAYERIWRLVDRVALGGLLSLVTLILGYVFGRSGQLAQRNSSTSG